MSDRTRFGLGLLGAAFVLGVLGDELLRATPLGINLFLWFAALLVALDLFAVVAALAFGALRAPRVHRAGLADYVVGLGNAGAAAAGRTVTLMQRDIDWRDLPKGAQAGQAVAVGRGLLLAAPLLLVFGALFVAADQVFQGFVTDVVPNGEEVFSHAALI